MIPVLTLINRVEAPVDSGQCDSYAFGALSGSIAVGPAPLETMVTAELCKQGWLVVIIRL